MIVIPRPRTLPNPELAEGEGGEERGILCNLNDGLCIKQK